MHPRILVYVSLSVYSILCIYENVSNMMIRFEKHYKHALFLKQTCCTLWSTFKQFCQEENGK